MTAYRWVYDSRHLLADCQELGSAPEPYMLDNIPFTRPQIGEQSIVMRTTFLALTLTFVACCFTPDGGAEYCDERVCVFVKVTYLASLLTT